MASVAHSPARLARTDLSSRQVVWLACASLAAVTALDLLDGRLGILFSVGFVLVVATMPLAIDVRQLLPAGVLPPVLLLAAVATVSLVAGDAIVVEGMPSDVGWAGRTLAGTVDRGVTLMVGHGLAILAVVVRIVTDPGHPRQSR